MFWSSVAFQQTLVENVVLFQIGLMVCDNTVCIFSCNEEEARFLTRLDPVKWRIDIFSAWLSFPHGSGLSTEPAKGERALVLQTLGHFRGCSCYLRWKLFLRLALKWFCVQ